MVRKLMLVAGLLAFVGVPAMAESELDGKGPKLIVQKLDPKAQTLTTYHVSKADVSVEPSELAKLPEDERKAVMESFINKVAVASNQVGTEKVEVEKVKSELDGQGSTSATWYRYRGCYSGRYYGGGFYYGGYRNYYRPYWSYGGYGYGYYGAGYGGYYGGCYGYGNGYYGGYYGAGYGGYVYGNVGCVGVSYSVYGW